MKNTRLEKIIEGLKRCAGSSFEDCEQCPYSYQNNGTKPFPQCAPILFNEAIELLQEQDTQIGKLRVIINTHYGKEATEELK